MSKSKSLIPVGNQKSWEDALENERWIVPQADIYELEKDFVLEINLPGVARENIKIKLESDFLVVMGRTNYIETINQNYLLKETDAGNYYRKFKLSKSINETKIEATYENGLLKIVLPKKDIIKLRNIEIK